MLRGLREGIVWLKISAEGFLTEQRMERVVASRRSEVRVELLSPETLPRGNLHLKVTGSPPRGIAWVQATRIGRFGPTASHISTPTGTGPFVFRWDDLPEGLYSVEVVSLDDPRVISLGAYRVTAGATTSAEIEGEIQDFGLLKVRMPATYPGWIEIEGEDGLVGSFGSATLSSGDPRKTREARVLLPTGTYKVSTGSPRGRETLSCTIRAPEETLLEFP